MSFKLAENAVGGGTTPEDPTTLYAEDWNLLTANVEKLNYLEIFRQWFRKMVYYKPWTTQTSAADNYWNSVCWSAELGLFVAVSNSGIGNRVMTSPDGINWTTRTSAANNGWKSVCWSAELGLFVAVATSGTGNRVMTSKSLNVI